MSNRGHRFSKIDKMAIDKSVLQGIQDGKTITEIKDNLLKDENIDISYSYLANEIAKVKKEIKKKAYVSAPRKGNRFGNRFTDEQKEIILKYIKEGVEKQETGDMIRYKLANMAGIQISRPQVYVYMKKYKEYGALDAPNPTPIERRTFRTPQEKLYAARGKVIDLYKDGFTTYEIAEEFHVKETDVQEFLSKRKFLNEDEQREIVYKSTKGATPEDLADEYGVSENTIKAMLVSAQNAISSDVVQDDETKQELDLSIAKNFLRFINTLMNYRKIYTVDAEKLDQQRQDILHELEMKDFTQAEKLKMLDRIQELGRNRRILKDYTEILEPITEFLRDESNMRTIKAFALKVSEAVNKLKDSETRVYFMRGAVND